MNILVINAGSSSVKFTCFHVEDESVLATGIVERIGLSETRLNYRNHRGDTISEVVSVKDTRTAVELISSCLIDLRSGVVGSSREIDAVGHRVVHGGEKIMVPMIIDHQVKKVIQDCIELAPLHNPPNLEGIKAAEEYFRDRPQVGVFDTAFHATIPEHAFLYGLPYWLYREYKIRRYGFHGISHKYVSQEAARFLDRPVTELEMITCHLGNGCSITAVNGGRSVDTSMGFTPLEGLIMGTRCGDLDPAIVFYLIEHKKLNHDQINQLLNKESGLLGLAGIGSSDLRDVVTASRQGQLQAEVALKTFTYRIKKYIGAYTAALGSLDVLVFTAGIGENSPLVRRMACADLNGLGISLDPRRNQAAEAGPREISHPTSRVKVLVVPTNEELEIARETVKVLESSQVRSVND